MSVDRINHLLLQQYVRGGRTSPITTISVAAEVTFPIYVVVDVSIGPPLVTLTEEGCTLTMHITGGTLTYLEEVAGEMVVQYIVPLTPGRSEITGALDLQQVTGTVASGRSGSDVVVDLGAGSYTPTFEGASTYVQTAVASALVNYFQDQAVTYSLGTGLFGPPPGATLPPALLPTSFAFTLQTDPSGAQCLIILITTQGQAGSSGPLGFSTNGVDQQVYPIPDGSSAALIVSSKQLYSGVILPQLQPVFQNLSGTLKFVDPGDPGAAWSLQCDGGYISAGTLQGTYSDKSTDTNLPWSSGPVSVPLDSLTIGPGGTGLAVSWSASWTTDFSYEYWADAGTTSIRETAKDSLTLFGSLQNNSFTLSVQEPQETVLISGSPKASVDFDTNSYRWWQKLYGNSTDMEKQTGAQMSTNLAPTLQRMFAIELAPVSVFALGNLLFPGQHVLDLQAAYAPGDLLLFGDVDLPVVLNPPQVTIGPGESVSISASTPSQTTQDYDWSIPQPHFGSLSANVYTAPSNVTGTVPVVVTAVCTGDLSLSGSALVLVESPAPPVAVDPAVVTVTAGEQVQFVGSIGGAEQAMTWSMDPSLPSYGTLSGQGVYQAPSPVTSAQQVTVIATDPSDASQTGTATITLSPTSSVVIQPAAVNLGPGQTQQFAATVGGSTTQDVVWSLLPPGPSAPPLGSIATDGTYSAPTTVSTPSTVTVVAVVPTVPVGAAIAAVALVPPA